MKLAVRLACAGSVVALCGLGCPPVTHASGRPAPRSVPVVSSADCVPLSATQSVDEQSPVGAAGSAHPPTTVTLSTADGSTEIVENIPPAGWLPATASKGELEYYHIPARPEDPADLLRWTREWVDHFKAVQPSGVCREVPSAHSITY